MKRRLLAAVFCAVLMFSLSFTAGAESAASNIQSYSTVTTEGDCRVSLSVTIRLETAVDSLSFPLPLGARNITKDGSGVNTKKTDSAIEVDISSYVRGLTGEVNLRFDYTLPDVVSVKEVTSTVDGETRTEYVPVLELPLLSGFSYPVETMTFDVQLPNDAIITDPVFSSIYHQDGIESSLIFAREGNSISGSLGRTLKDHETLTMTMPVNQAAFPSVGIFLRTGNPEVVPMTVCALLALLYWIFFLRGLPLIRTRRTVPPEGITAGELGTRLTLCGADLTMMVFSWAQLGYIMIHLDDNGRVMLHKRMDMGNERSGFEAKTFRALFGKHRVIDGTGYQYARLCRKVARKIPGQRVLCKKNCGNIKIFRILACAAFFFCGLCLAMNLTGKIALQALLAIVMAPGGALSAWLIQAGVYRLQLRYKIPLLISAGLSLVWIGIGIMAGQWIMALVCVLGQILAGFAAAYGGRRTDLGRQNASQILGLRSFFRKVGGEELQHIVHNDPEYFYNMAPFAMALGVEKKFAKNFGRQKLPPCPYFVCGIHSKMEASDWIRFLNEAALILDYRQRRMEWEKFAAIRFR